MTHSINLKDFIEKISYNKSQTYNKQEVLDEIAKIELLRIVPELPTTNIKNNKIYLVLNDESIRYNRYDLYVYANGDWEQIDSLEFNIGDYYTSVQINSLLNEKADKGHGHDNATDVLDGFMSMEDKAKLDTVEWYANHIDVDDNLNTTSTNPVQNKLVTTELNNKVNYSDVQDNFNSNSTTYPLSANKGKWLKDNTVQTAGTGLSKTGNTLNHSNDVQAVSSIGFKKIKYDTEGHITGSSNVAKSDITGFNLNTGDIKDTSAYTNIGSDANATQKTINDKINTQVGLKANASDVYKKTETMTSTEIGTAIANSISNLELFVLVSSLPTTNIKGNKFYLVPNNENINENVYDIYIRVNNKWEQIDSLEFNIADYYTSNQTDNLLSKKINYTDTQDNLNSTSTTYPLSANQGRVLDGKKFDTAGSGLTSSGTTVKHSNSVTALNTNTLKKIAYDTEGHITSTTTPSTADLPNNVKYENIKTGENDTLTLKNQKQVNDAINERLVDATQSKQGLMSSTDKTNLDNLVSSTSTLKNAHTHGNITTDGKVGTNPNYFLYTTTDGLVTSKQKIGQINTDGKIGSTANLPIITTTNGVLTTGKFGSNTSTNATDFVSCGDSRLSDTRTPTDDTVSTQKIQSKAVTTDKLDDSSVTLDKINSNAIDNTPTDGSSKLITSDAVFDSLKAHTHGNITNDGKVGTTANQILTTTTDGKVIASDTITKSKISDFSHTHGALTNGGTIESDITSVNRVVVTDSNKNIKTISKLPLGNVTHQDISGKINYTDVKNNLTSSDTDKPLSANQGKSLNESKFDGLATKNTTNGSAIAEIKANNTVKGTVYHPKILSNNVTSGLYKVTVNTDGHITATSNPNTTDLPNSETYSNIGSNLTNQKVVNDNINTTIGNINSRISGIINNNLSGIDLSQNHTHDDRYYTETELQNIVPQYHQVSNGNAVKFIKFLQIKVTGSWRDSTIRWTILKRSYPPCNISFNPSWNSTDSVYKIGNFYYDGTPIGVYVHLSATNTFDFYIDDTAKYGQYSISPISIDRNYMESYVTITKQNTLVDSLPTDTATNLKQATINPYYKDTDTKYTNGNGINLSGTTFSANFEGTASNIKANGTANVGALNTVARADHIHPSDSNKVDKTNGVSQVTDNNASNYTNIGSLSNGATQQTINNTINSKMGNKVDKVSGKGLSTNDFDGTYKGYVDNLVSSSNTLKNAHTHGNITTDGKVTTTTTNVSRVVVTDGDVVKSIAKLPLNSVTHQDISGKENVSNKSSSITTDTGSTSKYPTVKAVEDYAQKKGNYLTSVATGNINNGAVTLDKLNTNVYESTPTDGSSKLITSDGVYDAIQSIQNSIANIELIEIVQTLPTSNISTKKLYFKRNSSSESENLYDIYARVNNAWEHIDALNIDISEYLKKSELGAGTGLAKNGTTLSIKSSGVSATELASDSVITEKIKNGNVTLDKLNSNVYDTTPTDNSNKLITSNAVYDSLSGKASSTHGHGNIDNSGIVKLNGTAQASKNVVTDSNGKITTEDKYAHPNNTKLTTESLYKITTNDGGHITKGTAVGIDSTSGGTNNSTSLITSGALFSGLSGKANSNHSHGNWSAIEIAKDKTSDDFNEYTSEGIYYLPANTSYSGKTIANTPEAQQTACTLIVTRHAGVRQIVMTYNNVASGNKIYIRNKYSNSGGDKGNGWSNWYELYGTHNFNPNNYVDNASTKNTTNGSAIAEIKANNTVKGTIYHPKVLSNGASSGLYKITVNTDGHITATTGVGGNDLPQHSHSASDLPSSMTPSSHTHGNIDNSGILKLNGTAQKSLNVVTDANGYITTEAKYSHPNNKELTTESLYKITTNSGGHITKGTAVAIDSTSGGTSGSASLITSGAVYSGLSGKANTHSHNYLPNNSDASTSYYITAKGFKVSNSSGFLKADGSVDSSTYNNYSHPSSHPTTFISNDQKYNNIKSGESSTVTLTNQKLINDAINTKLGSKLESVASGNITNGAVTLAKLNSDVYDTTAGGTNGSSKLITSDAVYDGLSGKANSIHTHGNITNEGKLTATTNAVSKVMVTEASTNVITSIAKIPSANLEGWRKVGTWGKYANATATDYYQVMWSNGFFVWLSLKTASQQITTSWTDCGNLQCTNEYLPPQTLYATYLSNFNIRIYNTANSKKIQVATNSGSPTAEVFATFLYPIGLPSD